MWPALVFFFLLCFIVWNLTRQRYTPEGIPIIGNIPWLGCGWQLQRDGPYFLQRVAHKYGDVFQLYAGGKKLTYVLSESFLYTFYKAPEGELSFFDGVTEEDSSFAINVILPPSKDQNPEEQAELISLKVLRNYLTPMIRTASEAMFNDITDFTLNNAIPINQQQPSTNVDLFTLMSQLVIALSTRMLVSDELARDWKYINCINDYQHNALLAITSPPLLAKKPTKIAIDIRDSCLQQFSDHLHAHETSDSFIHYIATYNYKSTGRSLKSEAARFSFSFLFATIANTNTAATHCLLEILVNQQIKSKVIDELHSVIGDSKVITQEQLNRLKYLDCCLTETLRIYAPTVHLRKCKIDIKDDQGKVLFPKGTFVCNSPYLRHRDTSLYEDSEVFLPERHLTDKTPAKFSFLSFGYGRHYCLGKQLAETEIKLCLSKLLLNYDIEVISDQSSTHATNRKLKWFTFGLTMPANPILLHFHKK